jgi:heterodisulfide reductase subunit C
MTDLMERLRDRAKVAREENTGTAFGDAIHFEEAANEIERLCAAQPQYLANCLRAGACHGQCNSEPCTNYGKIIVVRRCVEERNES